MDFSDDSFRHIGETLRLEINKLFGTLLINLGDAKQSSLDIDELFQRLINFPSLAQSLASSRLQRLRYYNSNPWNEIETLTKIIDTKFLGAKMDPSDRTWQEEMAVYVINNVTGTAPVEVTTPYGKFNVSVWQPTAPLEDHPASVTGAPAPYEPYRVPTELPASLPVSSARSNPLNENPFFAQLQRQHDGDSGIETIEELLVDQFTQLFSPHCREITLKFRD